MRRGSSIRSDLACNRENRMRFRHRSGSEAFGIYRPLSIESVFDVQDVLGGAIPIIKKHLDKYRNESSEIVPLDEMGVTFVEKSKVQRAMRKGLLQRGFEPHRMIQAYERVAEQGVVAPIEVPIIGFSWFGRGNRKLVARLDLNNENYEELDTQMESVSDMLRQANAPELEVNRPDHVTLLRYGSAYDGNPLGERDQKRIRYIVRDQFNAQNVQALQLGGLVIGDSYSQPTHLSL